MNVLDHTTEALADVVETPLFAVVATLAAYRLGRELQRRTGGHALAQPVLVAIVVLVALLSLTGLDYATYLDGGALIGFWLGPATVALAVPLYRQVRGLRGMVLPMLVAIPVGAVVSIVTGLLVVRALGGSEELALTMAPKSATTPVAIAVSELAGGLPPLTAVFAIIAGIFGAVAGPWVMSRARITDRRARGLAMGASSHGVGTSRSLVEDETEGAFSGLSMGLSALAVSLLVPLVLLVLG